MEDIFETTDDDDADELPKLTRDAAAKNGAPTKKDPTAQKESEGKKRQLIAMGKAKGFLTYDEVSEHMPKGCRRPRRTTGCRRSLPRASRSPIRRRRARSQGQGRLGGRGPRRGERRGRDRRRRRGQEGRGRAGRGRRRLRRPVDPVRLYLRKMGLVALLTREGEVEISKRMEEGSGASFRWC